MISYCYYESPLGQILLTAQEREVVGAYFQDQKYYPQVTSGWNENPQHPPLVDACRQLDEYFAGKRQIFDLPLCPRGTEFQEKVWSYLQTIPYGQRTSYGAIALKVSGTTQTSRAVGAAIGRNPISVIIPCHRVVGHAGSLTGYAGGIQRKAHLLDFEIGDGALCP